MFDRKGPSRLSTRRTFFIHSLVFVFFIGLMEPRINNPAVRKRKLGFNPHISRFTRKCGTISLLFAIFVPMNLSTEKKIIFYSSLVVALLVNIPKLSQARGNALLSQFVSFDLLEFLFQLGYNFLYCRLVFVMNLRWFPRLRAATSVQPFAVYPVWNIFFLFLFCGIGIFIQRHLFVDTNYLPRQFFRAGYLARFTVSLLLEMLIIRIIYLLRQAQAKELETEQLKSRYLRSELELMKQQLNPHFFFNSLSTLSGIVRENPAKAQQFISHLSRIFRNLLLEQQQLIPLKEELQQLHSFTELLQMRFEEGIAITVDVPEQYHHRLLPHFSLQLLIENAAKHNRASVANPLQVQVFIQDDELCVKNNRQPVYFPQGESSGLGLINLNERYKILLKKEISIISTAGYFTVKLPLHE